MTKIAVKTQKYQEGIAYAQQVVFLSPKNVEVCLSNVLGTAYLLTSYH
jgi:hypothetical protein